VPEEKSLHVCVSISVVVSLFFKENPHFLMFRVAHGVPDQRTCLLHQKLQMLNCCVERKQARELAARAGSMEAEDSESGRFISVSTSVQPRVGHLCKIMELWHRNSMCS
jgi:hypothetical protein